jgi:hypothetical protein
MIASSCLEHRGIADISLKIVKNFPITSSIKPHSFSLFFLVRFKKCNYYVKENVFAPALLVLSLKNK